MQTGIHIHGGEVTKESVDALASAIALIFHAAADNRMEQDTVRVALSTLGSLGTVNGTTIEGSHVEVGR